MLADLEGLHVSGQQSQLQGAGLLGVVGVVNQSAVDVQSSELAEGSLIVDLAVYGEELGLVGTLDISLVVDGVLVLSLLIGSLVVENALSAGDLIGSDISILEDLLLFILTLKTSVWVSLIVLGVIALLYLWYLLRNTRPLSRER